MGFKDSIYWQIYSDVWGLHKKYHAVRDEDGYWQQLVDEVGDLIKKYADKPEGAFAKKLALLVLDEIERCYKDGRE